MKKAEYCLSVLGGYSLQDTQGKAIDIGPRKAKALLVWLAIQPGVQHSRDSMASLLWEDAGDRQGRHNLRQTLTVLRKSADRLADFLHTTSETISLSPDAIEVDALEFERLVQSSGFKRAMEVYSGEFLEGFNPHSNVYEDWLMEQREHYQSIAVSALEKYFVDKKQFNRYQDALVIGARLLSLEPLREDIHRQIMECQLALGRTGAALRQYRHCQAVLERELGIEPELDTITLYENILKRRKVKTPSTAPRPVSPAPEKPSDFSEIKQITLLCAGTDQANPDPEASEKLLIDIYNYLESRACEFHQASPTIDGQRVRLVFGIPNNKSEDTSHAIQIAHDLIFRFDGVGCGIASGRVLATWSLDSVDAVSITRLSGQAIGAAERLCASCHPGEVLVSDAVRRSCARVLSAQKHETHDCWRVEKFYPEAHTDPSNRFIGRRFEIAQLSALLHLCKDAGTGHVILIRGEAGIGKSRLSNEVLNMARQSGYHTLRLSTGSSTGQEYTLQRALPIQLLQSAGLFSLEGRPDQALLEQVSAQLDLGSGSRNLLYSHYDALDPEKQEQFFAGTSQGDRMRMNQVLIVRILEVVTDRQPLFLLVEDIHFANEESLAVLAMIAQQVTALNIVFLMTTRLEGEALQPQWRGAMGNAPLTTIDLTVFSGKELKELATDLAGADLPQLGQCVEKSQGNPFFLEQLILAAREGSSQIPDSIHSMIGARLDTLMKPDRDAAQAASVLGNSFSLEALRALLDDPGYTLDPLIAHGLIRPDANEYCFRHQLVRSGILEGLRRTRHNLYQLRAADYYQSIDPTKRALHLLATGKDDYRDEVVSLSKTLKAKYQFTKVLELLQPLQKRLPKDTEVQQLIAKTHFALGNLNQAHQILTALTKEDTNQSSHNDLLLSLAEIELTRDQFETALSTLDRIDHAKETETTRKHILRARAAFSMANHRQGIESGKLALKFAKNGERIDLEAKALSTLADAWYQTGNLSEARNMFRQTVDYSRKHGLIEVEAPNLAMLADLEFENLETKAASRHFYQALNLARDAGYVRHEILANIMLATLLCHMGEYATAAKHAEDAVKQVDLLGAPRFVCDAESYFGYSLAMLGEHERAYPYLAKAAEEVTVVARSFSAPWILSLCARLEPDPEAQRHLLKNAESILSEEACVSHCYPYFYYFSIATHLVNRQLDEAERLLIAFSEYQKGKDSKYFNWVAHVYQLTLDSLLTPSDTSLHSQLEQQQEFARGNGLKETEKFIQQFAPVRQ